MIIYLVGFMGTGKTVVGRELARQLHQQFVDMDSLIEEKENKQVSQIFSQDGEPYFRKLEKQVLKDISVGKNLVAACGGGIVLDKENIQIMKKTGMLICLNSGAEVILARTQGYRHRPLLNVDNPQKRIEELLKIRAPFYAQADYAIDTSDLVISSVVSKVLEIAKKFKHRAISD